MLKLSWRETLLYKRKKYNDLFKLMNQTAEGTARFNQLCVEDTKLQEWSGQTHQTIAAAIFGNPTFRVGMKEAFEQDGLGGLFDLHQKLYEKGFVTIEEAASAFSISAEEMRAANAAHPALFKAWHISGC